MITKILVLGKRKTILKFKKKLRRFSNNRKNYENDLFSLFLKKKEDTEIIIIEESSHTIIGKEKT